MTHEDAGHYRAKHPKGSKVREEVLQAVKEAASEGAISCAKAFTLVRKLAAEPCEVGMAVDLCEIKIEKCQLGLFGYTPQKRTVKPAMQVPDAMKKAIKEALVEGRLSCQASWNIAKRFGCPKMDVSSACETLSIKISTCQLGSF